MKPSSNKSAIELDDFLLRYDLNPKLSSDLEVKSTRGALVSVACMIMIAILMASEVLVYYHGSINDRITVDHIMNERMKINFNITFHALTCRQSEITLMDITGDLQLNATHSLSRKIVKAKNPPGKDCGDCYGSGESGMCCNTCSDVIFAYQSIGWEANEILKKAIQCKNLTHMSIDQVLAESGPQVLGGCNVAGTVYVNKIAGNFHFALGKAVRGDHGLVHQFSQAMIPYYNSSHTVHSLWFGDKNLDAQGPLDNSVTIIDPHLSQTGTIHYFLQVVPTEYAGSRYYPFTVTKRFTAVGEGSDEKQKQQKMNGDGHASTTNVVPGTFFVYEMSPFAVLRTDRSPGFLDLLTNLLAILGGAVAILTFLARVVV